LSSKGKPLGVSEVVDATEGSEQAVLMTDLEIFEAAVPGVQYRLVVTAINVFGESQRPKKNGFVIFTR
jgi:hypothetical protein